MVIEYTVVGWKLTSSVTRTLLVICVSGFKGWLDLSWYIYGVLVQPVSYQSNINSFTPLTHKPLSDWTNGFQGHRKFLQGYGASYIFAWPDCALADEWVGFAGVVLVWLGKYTACVVVSLTWHPREETAPHKQVKLKNGCWQTAGEWVNDPMDLHSSAVKDVMQKDLGYLCAGLVGRGLNSSEFCSLHFLIFELDTLMICGCTSCRTCDS